MDCALDLELDLLERGESVLVGGGFLLECFVVIVFGGETLTLLDIVMADVAKWRMRGWQISTLECRA